jgi:hypothetical protein
VGDAGVDHDAEGGGVDGVGVGASSTGVAASSTGAGGGGGSGGQGGATASSSVATGGAATSATSSATGTGGGSSGVVCSFATTVFPPNFAPCNDCAQTRCGPYGVRAFGPDVFNYDLHDGPCSDYYNCQCTCTDLGCLDTCKTNYDSMTCQAYEASFHACMYSCCNEECNQGTPSDTCGAGGLSPACATLLYCCPGVYSVVGDACNGPVATNDEMTCNTLLSLPSMFYTMSPTCQP